MKDDGNTCLVVANAQTIGPVALYAKGLLCAHALQVDRVHVRNQQDFFTAGALERGFDHAADVRRRVLHAVGIGRRIDELNFPAQGLQSIENELRNTVQTFAVATAGFNRHQVAQRAQQRLFLLLYGGPDGCVGRSPTAGTEAEQCGHGELTPNLPESGAGVVHFSPPSRQRLQSTCSTSALHAGFAA